MLKTISNSALESAHQNAANNPRRIRKGYPGVYEWLKLHFLAECAFPTSRGIGVSSFGLFVLASESCVCFMFGIPPHQFVSGACVSPMRRRCVAVLDSTSLHINLRIRRSAT